MKYTMVRVFLVAVSCCALLASANTASAGWRHRHGGGSTGGSSGGSMGAYGGYGSSGGYAAGYGSSGGYGAYADCYGYGYGGGSSGGYGGASSGGYAGGSTGGTARGGLFRRLFHHGGGAGGYGSSGGYYGAGYGSSGGSSGYSVSYGSSGGYGSCGGAVSYGSSGYGSSGGGYGSSGSMVPGPVPYESGYPSVSNQSFEGAGSLASYQADSADAIYLNVDVPPAAKVFVNDKPTTSIGTSRQFVSRGLQADKKYKFVVRAELLGVDGKVISEVKTVMLTPGQHDELSFASLAQTPVQTAVTLKVPADAKVILAGNATSATGETRTFRTSQLKAGDRWDDYVVEVEYDGKVKRETLRLVAGDDVALSFNFDDEKSLVASR